MDYEIFENCQQLLADVIKSVYEMEDLSQKEKIYKDLCYLRTLLKSAKSEGDGGLRIASGNRIASSNRT